MTGIFFLAGLFVGTFLGFLVAAIFAAGGRADDYEPIEHSEPRVMPRIWDGYSKEGK